MALNSEERLIQSILETDASVDVQKGPVYDWLLRPVPAEIDLIDASTAKMQSIFRRAPDQDLLDPEEVVALGRNLRVAMPAGRRAHVVVTFILAGVPTREIRIPAGTPVATADGVYVFVTDFEISGINADTAVAFWNAQSGRYEVPVPATATREGTTYNLPAYRLTRVMAKLEGIGSVSNTTAATGGSDPASVDDYYTDIQNKLNGFDPSSPSAIVGVIREQTGITSGFVIVPASDRTNFRRAVVGNAYDWYCQDSVSAQGEDSFVASSSTDFTLSRSPVLSVSGVWVDGTLLAGSEWVFVAEASRELRGSTAGRDYVRLSGVPATGAAVRIQYVYDSLCRDVQDVLDDYQGQNLDIVVRRMTTVGVQCYCELFVSTSNTSVVDAVKSAITDYCGQKLTVLTLEGLRTSIMAADAAVRGVSFSRFCRADAVTPDVKDIVLALDDVPVLDTTKSGNIQVGLAT